jgi:diguanylate cyclase (GGDEF)-like protein
MLATAPVRSRDVRLALVATGISFVFFLCALPFASQPLGQVPAFIPTYVSLLVICDLITAALLFGQYSVLRSLALLVLASGYLFTACVTFAYALTFPGLFDLPGVPRAGPQTSSAMYMFWHAGFPLFVLAYAWLSAAAAPSPSPTIDRAAHRVILWAVAAVMAVTMCFTLLVTLGHALLPAFLEGNRTTALGHGVLAAIWLLDLLALGMLWRRKSHTVLDVWLMVVLCAWLFDIALGAVFNSGRYDLGWYAGRSYGVVAASFLLVVLVTENTRQYARLVRASQELRDANASLAQLSRHDALTGLANRRSFDEYLSEQWALARRHQRSLALVLCDVDHFKAYNDHYGHPAGDACLARVAAVLRASCARPADLAARYGGEEFALILPDTDLAGGSQVAESARKALAALKLPHAHSSTDAYVSLSGGVAVLHPDSTISAHELIAAADAALYQAKHSGRNQTSLAPMV